MALGTRGFGVHVRVGGFVMETSPSRYGFWDWMNPTFSVFPVKEDENIKMPIWLLRRHTSFPNEFRRGEDENIKMPIWLLRLLLFSLFSGVGTLLDENIKMPIWLLRLQRFPLVFIPVFKMKTSKCRYGFWDMTPPLLMGWAAGWWKHQNADMAFETTIKAASTNNFPVKMKTSKCRYGFWDLCKTDCFLPIS